MRRLLVVGLGVVLAGCASAGADREVAAPQEAAPLTAGATLKDKDGKDVGAATLIQTAEGLRIAITGYRMPPGPKAVAVSAVGVCQPPEFASAGASRGELPGMTMSAAGEGGIDTVTSALTLQPGGPNSLLAGNGSAVVVSAPGGARLACGVITRD
ncbi:MAG: hypothetical protein L0027_10905 [Candidatus Rokubacteria bacterium]|nr:hypothetical protein [Candidatus Rokubacteria bacterium]